MFCKKCGALINDDEIYCYNCQSLNFDNTEIKNNQSEKNNVKSNIDYIDKIKYTSGQANLSEHNVSRWIGLSILLMFFSFWLGLVALIICLGVYKPAVLSNNFEKANSTKGILKGLLITGFGIFALGIISVIALVIVRM